MNCGVGLRCGLAMALLWLWHRPTAVALIQPLAWETPYAAGAALKKKKKRKKERKEKEMRDAEGETHSVCLLTTLKGNGSG